jgi:hypothetical protein
MLLSNLRKTVAIQQVLENVSAILDLFVISFG